jgi:proline-specific peptidase
MKCRQMLVRADDTRLNVEERGSGGLPLFVLHGGPGLDHTMFGGYLDALGDVARLLFVDQRSQGRSDPAPPETWTLPRMAQDVEALARELELERYAVLGHSYGAFVALQHACDFPGRPVASIISSGLPSERFLEAVERNLAAFEPVELRGQVTGSWAREAEARTQEDVRQLLSEQLPFHFADPLDPRINEVRAAIAGMAGSPDVVRAGATSGYGHIELEDRLAGVSHPVLVLAGRHDRTCSPEGAQAIAAGIPGAELVILEHSGHMGFVEENDAYLGAVRDFLGRIA